MCVPVQCKILTAFSSVDCTSTKHVSELRRELKAEVERLKDKSHVSVSVAEEEESKKNRKGWRKR